jgi:hypothetical protein
MSLSTNRKVDCECIIFQYKWTVFVYLVAHTREQAFSCMKKKIEFPFKNHRCALNDAMRTGISNMEPNVYFLEGQRQT